MIMQAAALDRRLVVVVPHKLLEVAFAVCFLLGLWAPKHADLVSVSEDFAHGIQGR